MTLRDVLFDMMALANTINHHKDAFCFMDAGIPVSTTTHKRNDLPRTLPQMELCANRKDLKANLKNKMDLYL